jgi:hypothetical protein
MAIGLESHSISSSHTDGSHLHTCIGLHGAIECNHGAIGCDHGTHLRIECPRGGCVRGHVCQRAQVA